MRAIFSSFYALQQSLLRRWANNRNGFGKMGDGITGVQKVRGWNGMGEMGDGIVFQFYLDQLLEGKDV